LVELALPLSEEKVVGIEGVDVSAFGVLGLGIKESVV
jgi:hypothetical protein